MLRLPDGMRARIAEVAKASGRSMNAEIVARLEASFSVPSQLVQAIQQLERVAAEKNLQLSISIATEMDDAP